MCSTVGHKKEKSEVKLIPWCFIYNLVGHVLSRLNALQKCNLLVFHKFIPVDEIHVKIGGDMGGGSFKMTYQIANVNNPNKLENTIIFSIFETKDSRAKMKFLQFSENIILPLAFYIIF